MGKLFNIPGTIIQVDLNFLSHIACYQGVRYKDIVTPKISNLFRKLLGIKPVRPHYVHNDDWFCGWHDPKIKMKINGVWHQLYFHSNARAKRMYNYIMDSKNHPEVALKEPNFPLKDYYNYGSN